MYYQNFSPLGPAVWSVRCLTLCHRTLLYIEIKEKFNVENSHKNILTGALSAAGANTLMPEWSNSKKEVAPEP